MLLCSRLQHAGTLAVVAILTILCGCVTSPGGGGGMLGGGGGSNATVMKLDGRDVKAEELLKSPVFRQTIRQWAMIEHLKQQAAAENITADTAKVDEQLLKQKTEMQAFGQNWSDMLEQQGMTEEDVREMMSFQNIVEQLAQKKAGEIPDAEIEKAWKEREESYRAGYASENFLTETQKKELTYEDMKDWVKQQLVKERGDIEMQGMFEEARKEMKLELPPLGNAEAQATYIKLIVGKIEEETPAEDAEAAPDEAAPDAAAAPGEPGAAGDDAAGAEAGGETGGGEAGSAGADTGADADAAGH